MIERRSLDDPDGRRRKIAVINSNSSTTVTQQLADTARPALLPGTHASFFNPVRGPQGIDTALDIAVSAAETALLVRELGDEFDAFVIACGNDPGLAAARSVTTRPVVGIAEAGFLEACGWGSQFSVAVLGPEKVAGMRGLVNSYGLEARLATIVPILSSSRAAAADPADLLSQLAAACEEAGSERLGDSLVLTGSVMGRIAPELAAAIGIPVVSGLLAGLRLAETLAERGQRLPSGETRRTSRTELDR